MADKQPIFVTEDAFKEQVLESTGPAFVFFEATWCHVCQDMTPAVEALTEEFTGKVACFQVDVDESPKLSDTYCPEGYPVFLFLKAGVQQGSIVGSSSLEVLRHEIQSLLD